MYAVVLKLPSTIATKSDLTQVHRELRIFLDLTMQSIMRHDSPVKMPAVSSQLRQLAADNQLSLANQQATKKLLAALETTKKQASVVHISFASEPTHQVLYKIVQWFRQEVDPNIVISVGLQRSIAAGVVLRTPNRQFDFSLRKHLEHSKAGLSKIIANTGVFLQPKNNVNSVPVAAGPGNANVLPAPSIKSSQGATAHA
jgi:F0F1-type ATP synthase delta subunit